MTFGQLLRRRAVGQRETVLEEAQRLVQGDRQAAYSHPKDDMGRTAQMWSGYFGFHVTAEQVAHCMVLVKLSRECHKHHRDNLVDAAGYLLCADMIREATHGR